MSDVQFMVLDFALLVLGYAKKIYKFLFNYAGFDIISIFGSTIRWDIDSLWATSYGMQTAVVFCLRIYLSKAAGRLQ